MESASIKITVIPIVNIETPTKTFPFGTEIEEDIIVNYSTTLKDISIGILHNVGLSHLTDKYRTYIKIPSQKEHVLVGSLFEHLNIVQIITLFESSVDLEIITNEKNQDFYLEEFNDELYKNIYKCLIEKFISIKERLKDCPTLSPIDDEDDDDEETDTNMSYNSMKNSQSYENSSCDNDSDFEYQNMNGDFPENNNEP